MTEDRKEVVEKKEIILVVNHLTDLLTVNDGLKRYYFRSDEPVKLDYGTNPKFVQRVLTFVEISICNRQMLKEINERKGVVSVPDPSIAEKQAGQKKEADKKKAAKAKKDADKKAKAVKDQKLKLEGSPKETVSKKRETTTGRAKQSER